MGLKPVQLIGNGSAALEECMPRLCCNQSLYGLPSGCRVLLVTFSLKRGLHTGAHGRLSAALSCGPGSTRVAIESPLDPAPNLSLRLGNTGCCSSGKDLQPVLFVQARGAYNRMVHLSASGAGSGSVIAASARQPFAQGVGRWPPAKPGLAGR